MADSQHGIRNFSRSLSNQERTTKQEWQNQEMVALIFLRV
jgi:hypothetical protein